MATLLGVNFGSQKHAYFQTRITIHELTNVPMVAGQFKAKWKVEHTHNLASAIASAAAASTSSSTGTAAATTTTSTTTATTTTEAKQNHLNHRKSTSTLSSSFDRDENGSIDSGSIRRTHHKGGDDASSTYSNNNKNHRKGGYRIFSGIRDALKPHSSSQTSPASSKKSKTPRDSQDGRQSMDVRSNDGDDDGSEEASEVLTDHHHARESSQQSSSGHGNQHHSQHHHHHGFGNNHLSYDPRGETSSASVKDSRVVWEKLLDVGVRFNVEKPRSVSGGSHSGASLNEQAASKSSRSTDAPMRRSTSQRDVLGSSAGILQHDGSGANTPHDMSSWGMLASSELRISVKADVPTGTEGNHADHQTMMKFGHVSINLAEFAPHPHHHHHHHHSTHPSGRPGAPHASHSEHHHHHILSRTETRRYLLLDGPTNATVKVTVEMKHVGGTREYQVPSNKRGLLVGSIVPTLEGSSPTGSKGPSSSAGSEGDDGSSSNGGSADHPSSETHGGGRSTSVTKALSDWSPHSVARHSRIPEENLRTKLTHKDTARAVKEAGGGGRLAFSFVAGAHHDRPPESVIDSLFDSNMLTPTPSRDKKASLQQQQQKSGQDKSEQTPKARDMASKHLSIAGQSAKSRNSSASSKSGGIRWDLSTEKTKSSSSSIPESSPEEQTPKSTKSSYDSEKNPEPSRSNPLSSSRRKEVHDAKTFGEDKYSTSVQLQPPQTPPDIVRNEELSKAHPALDYPPPWSETSTATETPPTSPTLQKKPSRRTLGLTKEAAIMAGYRGAGWGTLELSKHSSNLSIDSSDSGSEQGNHSLHNHHRSPTFAYLHDRTRSPSPSPLQQLAH